MIGVIVPFYNNETYIHRCIDSLLNQSYTNFKIIAVDDGSPDRCGAICDDYSNKHSNISVIHQQNQGLSAARNAGLEKALVDNEIDWITFVDGDDWVHRDYLFMLNKACSDTGAEISIAHFRRTDNVQHNEGKIVYNVSVINADHAISISSNSILGMVAWGKLYKKHLFEIVRFPLGRLHEDEFTTYRVLSEASSIAVVDSQLYYYFINYEGIMLSKWSIKRLDSLDACMEQIKFFKEKNYSLSFEQAQWKIVRGIEYSITASNGNHEADQRINTIIKEFLSEVNADLSPELKKRLKKVKPFGLYRFKNRVKVFRNYLREKGLKYTFSKIVGHFRNG